MNDYLFPYDTLIGDVALSVREARIDGKSIPKNEIDALGRRVPIHLLERARWDDLVLKVSVNLPSREVEAFDAAQKTVDVVLRCVCAATSARQSVVLKRTGAAVWEGVIELSYDAYDKAAVLEAIATVDDPDRHIIGTSEPWRIMFDPAPKPTMRHIIDCEYISFSKDERTYLRPYAKEISYFDFTTTPRPTLWLNQDIPGLRELLGEMQNARAQRNPWRDLTSADLSAKAYLAMFNATVASLNIATDSDEIPEMPGSWQGSVLRRVMPALYPNESTSEALLQLKEAAVNDTTMQELQSRVAVVIDQVLGTSRSIQTLIADAGTLEASENA